MRSPSRINPSRPDHSLRMPTTKTHPPKRPTNPKKTRHQINQNTWPRSLNHLFQNEDGKFPDQAEKKKSRNSHKSPENMKSTPALSAWADVA